MSPKVFRRRGLMGFFVASLMALTASASVKEQIQFKVEKWTLANGLTVLVHVDHSMPIMSYQQWFRVGSSYEKVGRTGLAHFFEHLMFKGTKKYSRDQYERLIQMNGGSNNAFTTEDYTGYYTNMPGDKLELVMDLESDRMRNLIFDETEIKNEREVVKEERRMRTENSVYGSMFELIRQTRFKTSPYRWPVIGYMPDLNATQTSELKDFYNRYYAPNNAVVVIAGDVNLGTVKKLVDKYYGGIVRQELPAFNPPAETVQQSARVATLEKDVQSRTVALVYPGVKAGDDDSYALDLLSSALGTGTSSRLYKKLVYKSQLATGAQASSSTDKLSGDFMIILSLVPGASQSRAVSLVDAEIKEVKDKLLSAQELAKLKNQVLLSYVKGLQTMSSRANSLALNEILFGDYARLFDDFDRYEKLTVEDLQRVAKAYLLSSRRSLIEVVPKASPRSVQ